MSKNNGIHKQRVRDLRKSLGDNAAEFAARFARSPRTVEDWELGRRNPDPLALQVIAQLELAAAKKARKKASRKSAKNPM